MQNRGNIFIILKKCTKNVPSKFKMLNLKTIITPSDNNVKFTKDMCPEIEQEKSEMKKHSTRPMNRIINVCISWY